MNVGYFNHSDVYTVAKQLLPDFSAGLEHASPAKLQHLIYLFIQDLSRLQQTNERLRADLEAQEALVREVHHRVKNNFHNIHGLLAIEEEQVSDQQAREALRNSRNRVLAMAMLHEQLCQSADLANLDFGEFLEDFCTQVLETFNAERITLRVDNHIKFVLPEKKAAACALILNELVTNALKYAFPEGRAGEIRITVQQDHDSHLLLIVKDDGCGLPDEALMKDSKRLGLHLVQSLVTHNLNGELTIDRSGGTTFTIRFVP